MNDEILDQPKELLPPSEFAELACEVRERTGGQGAMIIIMTPERGLYFAVDASPFMEHELPGILKFLSHEVEKINHHDCPACSAATGGKPN